MYYEIQLGSALTLGMNLVPLSLEISFPDKDNSAIEAYAHNSPNPLYLSYQL